MKANANGENSATQKTADSMIEKNKKLVSGIVIALLVVVGGFFAYTHLYKAPREEKAQAAIFQGQTYFGIGAFNEALNGDNRGYTGFLRVMKDFSGTPTANLATGYAGICYAQLGNYKEALNYLNDFKANDALIAPAVTAAMGDCYVELDQLDKAVKAYLDAVKAADRKITTGSKVNNSISPLFLMKAALVYEKQQKNAEALKVYQRIKDDYVNSYQVQSGEVEKYIERATAMVAAAPPSMKSN